MLSNLINKNEYINNLHRKALLYLNEKKFLRSEKIYLEILKQNSCDDIALLNLGVIAEKQNKSNLALKFGPAAVFLQIILNQNFRRTLWEFLDDIVI